MTKVIAEAAALSSPVDSNTRRYRSRLIEGNRWGSSGFYSQQVLEEAAKGGIFSKGLAMFADHPTESESNDRPERSIRDLWAALDSDAVYEANGPEGPGLYADIVVWPHVAPVIEAMKDHIGLSIRAFGEIGYGEAAGRSGPIVEKLTGAASVDFVTAAGAGGRIGQLLESARRIDAARGPITADDLTLPEPAPPYVPVSAGQTTTESTQEVGMDPQAEAALRRELEEAKAARDKALQERDQAVQERDKAIQESRAREVAEAATTRARSKVGALPQHMADRVVAEAVRDLPRKDDQLDEAAFDTAVDKLIEAEKAYAKAFAAGGLVGFGDSDPITESKPAPRTNPWGREIKEG